MGIAAILLCDLDHIVRPEFFYKLIYKPSYCDFFGK